MHPVAGPQQTNDSTGLDLDGHATHDVPFAKRFMQVYRFEHVADSSLIIRLLPGI